MKRFYKTVVRWRKMILILFFLVAAVSAFLSQLVGVNYDMKDYLPKESASTVSFDVMEAEFDGGIPNARVMVRDVTIAKALEYEELLMSCEGVTVMIWRSVGRSKRK